METSNGFGVLVIFFIMFLEGYAIYSICHAASDFEIVTPEATTIQEPKQ